MTIINLMLGAKRGGLEQAAIDYAEALALTDLPHHTIVPPDSWVLPQLERLGLPVSTLHQRGGWDLRAAWTLRRRVRQLDATAVICHGNRAISLALLARAVRVIAVAHNYKTKRYANAEACFAITRHALDQLATCLPREKLFLMPNMVRASGTAPHARFQRPPVLGSMGRFVAKKGFALLIEALAILHRRGVDFRATIGGGGPEESALHAAIAHHGLGDRITLTGWIDDKAAFYAGIDLFILPSHHEPFGIVLIEAMEAGLPVIATAAEGPREIIESGVTGTLTPLGDADALANAIGAALADMERTARCASAGQHAVRERYSPHAMARRLQQALDTILTGN